MEKTVLILVIRTSSRVESVMLMNINIFLNCKHKLSNEISMLLLSFGLQPRQAPELLIGPHKKNALTLII